MFGDFQSNGEARTILSRRNSSPVKDFCLLPPPVKSSGNSKCKRRTTSHLQKTLYRSQPLTSSFRFCRRSNQGTRDAFPVERPLTALCELNAISVVSLHSGAMRHALTQNAQKVVASRHALAALCQMQIVVFAANDFRSVSPLLCGVLPPLSPH